MYARTSAIEVDGGLQGDDGLGVVGGLELLQRLVEAGDVRLVVLLVVQLHDLAADGGLQGAVVVVQVRQALRVQRGRRHGPALRPPAPQGRRHRVPPHAHHRRRRHRNLASSVTVSAMCRSVEQEFLTI
jgi:hypothetical protein